MAEEKEQSKIETKKEETKTPSKPALEKVQEKKAALKETKKEELTREYVIPLKRSVLNVPRYRRAKKAIKAIKEFLAKHMRVEERDLRKVKVDINLNNEIWFRGIKKPANKIKVKATKKEGIVYAELAEIPAVVGFKIKRLEKRKAAVKEAPKVEAHNHEHQAEEVDKDKDGVEDKKEEKEDKKATEEKQAKENKQDVKKQKHDTKGSHKQKTMPVRKKLK